MDFVGVKYYETGIKGQLAPVVDCNKIIMVDYLAGVIFLRQDQKKISNFQKYNPFGIYAFEFDGIVGIRKEKYSKPNLYKELVSSLAFFSSFLNPLYFIISLYAPTHIIQEETFHVYDRRFNPNFVFYSVEFFKYLSLEKFEDSLGIPNYFSSLLYSFVLSAFNPVEIKAKVSKFLWFGYIPNLDCDAAWARYKLVLFMIASRQLENEPGKITNDRIINRIEDLRGTEIRFKYSKKYWNPHYFKDGTFISSKKHKHLFEDDYYGE